MKPLHCCEKFKVFHSSLPKISPIGFVWLCDSCLEAPQAQQNVVNIADGDDSDEINPAEKSVEVANESISPIPEVSKIQKQEKKLCKYYVYRKCKHGAKGNDCPHDHPQ